MATKVYGASDDLIEFEGDVHGEVGYREFRANDEVVGMLVIFSDGTQVVVKYGKPGGSAIWSITPVVKGTLFERIDICDDEDAKVYSDVLHFKDGLKRAIAASAWQLVR